MFCQTCNAYLPGNIKRSRRTQNSETDRSNPPISYADLISKLKNNWEPPSTYLEKRGYLPKQVLDKENGIKKTANTGSSSSSAEEYEDIDTQFDENEVNYQINPNTNNFKYLDLYKKTSNSSGSSTKFTTEKSRAFSTQKPLTSTTTEQSSNWFQKIKSKIGNIFGKKENSSSIREFDPLEDFLVHLDESNHKPRRNSQKFFDFKYDDSWLTDENSNNVDDNDNLNIKRQLDVNFAPSSSESMTIANGKSLNNSENLIESSKYSNILKNLTQADIEYVKKFLKCFKDNKEDFSIEYLHKNSSKDLNSDQLNAKQLNQNGNFSTNPNTAVSIEKIKDKNLTCTLENEKIPVSNETSVNENKNPTQIQIKNELQNNEKNGNCTNTNKDRYIPKLKFLAHLHHSVYEVGKLPQKPVDLKLIQDMIEKTRENYGIVFTGTNDNTTVTTPCSLIHFGDKLLDDDVSGSALLTDEDDQRLYNLISKYLEDTPSEVKSKSVTAFKDEPRKNSQLLKKLNKKRETKNSDNFDEKRDKVLSDVTSSLRKLSRNDKATLNLDDYYDDYNFEDHNMKTTKSPKDKNIENDENEKHTNAKAHKTHKKKKRPKPKNKNVQNQNNKKVHSDFYNFNTQERIKFPNNRIIEMDQPMKPDEEKNIPHNQVFEMDNDYSSPTFSELNDIKFRVNSKQEEDIDKFIQSLNSPPEIFNFDVDKYIRRKSISETEKPTEPPVTRTYYEFLLPPSNENEIIPFIPNDKSDHSLGSQDIEKSLELEDNIENVHRKRDVLREYIKGISNHINDRKALEYHQSECSNTKKSNPASPLMENDIPLNSYQKDVAFSNNDDQLYETPVIPEKKENDDFIDKFYLLNDGNFEIYGSDKPKFKPDTYYDPVNLGIDLDLDKKFRELTYPESELDPSKEENGLNKENRERNKVESNTSNNYENLNGAGFSNSGGKIIEDNLLTNKNKKENVQRF